MDAVPRHPHEGNRVLVHLGDLRDNVRLLVVCVAQQDHLEHRRFVILRKQNKTSEKRLGICQTAEKRVGFCNMTE